MSNLYTLVRENGRLKMVRTDGLSDSDEEDFKPWSSTQSYSEQVKRTPVKKPKHQKYEKFCLFCKKAGFTFNDHFMKKGGLNTGEIVCPRILNSECTNCGEKGHTKSYCKKPLYSSEEERTSSEKLSSSFESNGCSGEFMRNSLDENRNSLYEYPSCLDEPINYHEDGTDAINRHSNKLDLSNCTDSFGQTGKSCEFCKSKGFPLYVVTSHNEWERLGCTSVLICPARHFESLHQSNYESKNSYEPRLKPKKLFDEPEYSDFEPTIGKSRFSLTSTEVSSSLESNVSGISRCTNSYEY